jgi:hypothetical protein
MKNVTKRTGPRARTAYRASTSLDLARMRPPLLRTARYTPDGSFAPRRSVPLQRILASPPASVRASRSQRECPATS